MKQPAWKRKVSQMLVRAGFKKCRAVCAERRRHKSDYIPWGIDSVPKSSVVYAENGVTRTNYYDGCLKEEISWSNGCRNGVCRQWYHGGELAVECNYRDDLLDGIKRRYFQSGKIFSETTYFDGVKQGIMRRFFLSGQVYSETTYYNGVENGPARQYYKSGRLESELNFVDDQLQGQAKYFNEGEKIVTVNYENNLKEGIERRYTRNGVLYAEIPFIHGHRHGISKYYKVDANNGITRAAYIDDIRVPLELYENPEKITMQVIMDEGNIELRRVLIGLMGYERFLSQLPGKIIDRSGEYSLHKIDQVIDNDFRYDISLLKVRCASTGAWYVLRVPPFIKTCLEALAWTFTLETGEYILDEET